MLQPFFFVSKTVMIIYVGPLAIRANMDCIFSDIFIHEHETSSPGQSGLSQKSG